MQKYFVFPPRAQRKIHFLRSLRYDRPFSLAQFFRGKGAPAGVPHLDSGNRRMGGGDLYPVFGGTDSVSLFP